jgi:hypothetical protein
MNLLHLARADHGQSVVLCHLLSAGRPLRIGAGCPHEQGVIPWNHDNSGQPSKGLAAYDSPIVTAMRILAA